MTSTRTRCKTNGKMIALDFKELKIALKWLKRQIYEMKYSNEGGSKRQGTINNLTNQTS